MLVVNSGLVVVTVVPVVAVVLDVSSGEVVVTVVPRKYNENSMTICKYKM